MFSPSSERTNERISCEVENGRIQTLCAEVRISGLILTVLDSNVPLMSWLVTVVK